MTFCHINADLLQQAKQLNINLSQTLALHLAEIVRRRRQWLEETRTRWMNTTIASKRAARSATACGGFEGAPGFDASLAAMARTVGKK